MNGLLPLAVALIALITSGCDTSMDSEGATQGLTAPYARIAGCLERDGIERVRSVDEAPMLWRDIAADNVQDAGGGGSGDIAYRGIRPVGGTETRGEYMAS
jgi:hypothetical protein